MRISDYMKLSEVTERSKRAKKHIAKRKGRVDKRTNKRGKAK